MFEVHKEYNSTLLPDAQQTDEEWFDDVEHVHSNRRSIIG